VVKTILMLVCSAVALSLAACSGEDDAGKAEQAKPVTTAPATSAAVSVKADKTHAVQPEDEITLTISVKGFRLAADGIGSENQSGVGHYRVYLDDASGEAYLAAGADATTKVTIPADISDGSHDLRVVLHNNDETPVDPPVEGSVLLIVYRL